MKLYVQAAAEQDILDQYEWYTERQLIDIARQFVAATRTAFDAIVVTPAIGAPRQTNNPKLAGLRTWPLSGFDQFRVFYVERPDLLIVIRVLHGKRDVGTILNNQQVRSPPSG